MNIVTAPNSWSCLPSAFATATGIPLETLLESIGHDGSDIAFPNLPDPHCRRGFLGQEIALALLNYHFLVGTFERHPFGYIDDDNNYKLDHSNRVRGIMEDSIGVLGVTVKATEKLHAVAWDGSQCYDPIGLIYPLNSYRVHVYYLLGRF